VAGFVFPQEAFADFGIDLHTRAKVEQFPIRTEAFGQNLG